MSTDEKKSYLKIGLESTEIPIAGPLELGQLNVEREEYLINNDNKTTGSNKPNEETKYLVMEIGLNSTRLPIQKPINIKQVNVERDNQILK